MKIFRRAEINQVELGGARGYNKVVGNTSRVIIIGTLAFLVPLCIECRIELMSHPRLSGYIYNYNQFLFITFNVSQIRDSASVMIRFLSIVFCVKRLIA